MNASSSIRPSPIAGTWYKGDPNALAKSVDGYISAADLRDLKGELVGIIAPHAGHVYSGPVAGYAFSALKMESRRREKGGKPFDLVAIISPMHQPYMDPLLTSAHDSYFTPLGVIPIDHGSLDELDRSLQARLGHGLTRIAHDQEHSLEIELPFLQRVIPGEFKLLPVMVRSQSPETSEALGLALAEVLKDRNAILVGSTDLSHFYNQETAKELDGEMMRCFESFSPEEVFQAERSGKGQACGHSAVAAVMWAAKGLGGDTVKLLKYATSGDVTGDHASVVGYGAAAILRSGISS